MDRYARQTVLPGFGAEAQARLAGARVLVIGAGGLGSTVIPALAAAGVGTLGIVDDDVVELSNLHRQHIHGVDDLGGSKVRSAAESVRRIDPSIVVLELDDRLTAHNAQSLIKGYDLVVDGCDDLDTRYVVDDVAALADVPVVWGSVSQFSGQVSVAWASRGPRYRDLFPSPPPADSVLSCAVGGVFPTAVAVIGALMATEALKILTGVGSPLLGRLTLFDARTGGFRHLDYARDPASAAPAPPAELSVGPERFAELRNDGALVIDVREPWELEIARMDDAVSIPLDTLDAAMPTLDVDRGILVVCHHGVRSRTARDRLIEHGFTARHLAGGIDGWARFCDPGMTRY